MPHIRIGEVIRIPASQLERLYEQGVPDDGSPAGDSFAGADPAGAPTYHAGSRGAEANRQAAEARARDDEKRRHRPPPIGLRVTN